MKQNKMTISTKRPNEAIHKSLQDAIAQKRLVRFFYGNKERIAEPHDYGIQKGQPTLLIYQIRGQSTAGNLPNWRWINVSRISEFQILDESFPGSRAGESSKHHEWEMIFARVVHGEEADSRQPNKRTHKQYRGNMPEKYTKEKSQQ